MRQGILAAAFLALSAGFASADYVIIVANVGVGRELATGPNANVPQMGGMRGMMGGVGMMGGAGMQGPAQGGAGGVRPPGMNMNGGQAQGMPPGGGGAGMGGAGMRGGGPSGGMMMGMGGGSGAGMRGGGPSGGMMMGGGSGAGMMGNRGSGPSGGMMMGMGGGSGAGMMGNRGGMGAGMMGMAGMMGLLSNVADDVDDNPDYVIAVIEVKTKKNLLKVFENPVTATLPAPVFLPERLGRSCQLLRNPSFGELFVIAESSDKKNTPMPTVAERFNQDFAAKVKEKASVSDFLSLAEWALQHGLVGRFPEVMDKVVEGDNGHSSAVAYVKIKAELDRKPGDDSLATSLRKNLLSGYKLTETPHYLIVHNAANDTAVEIKTHAEHLENAFRGYYYWFALRGIALPVPQTRQVVVLTNKSDDFEQLRKILTSGPVVVDGFFARRENLAVMYSKRQDDPYKALTTFWENWNGKGYQRTDILQGNNIGMPKNGVPKNVREAGVQGMPLIAEAQMVALMLKALEQEAELATVSHEASRQLLFASGLLPRNVAVPEWALFGMGSFFETPLQSPWATIGAPSPYYLPRWRELQGKGPNQGGLEKTQLDTLRKVVTDGYFRTLPPEPKAEGTEHFVYEATLRKARTVAWSLAYFLAQTHLDGLRHYFAELSKMPRDLELDDTVLLGCFARAFGCVDSNNNVDDTKLKALANQWYGYWQTVHFESEPVMKEIRERIAKKVKEEEEKALSDSQQNNGQQRQGGMFPGLNPNLPPGMNGPQGGAGQGGRTPRGNNPQQNAPGGKVPPSPPQQGGKSPPAPPSRPQ